MATGRLTWEPIRTRDSATLVGGATIFFTVGTPLTNPSYILKMVNNSTVLVNVSIDGATTIDVCPSTSFWLYDESKVGIISSVGPVIPAGTQIYVSAAAAGTGLIYLVTQYTI